MIENIINKIDELLSQKENVIVAIDGSCASGKSFISIKLQEYYHCEVIKMDHFFLPLEKRTTERLSTPGGNIDYERFKECVIDKLGTNFSYQIFDCSVMKLNDFKSINKNKLTIMEGSYSLHPYFGKYYDLSIFLDIDYDKQLQRILHRDGEKMLSMFVDKWIKYEKMYHEYYKLKESVDIYFKSM